MKTIKVTLTLVLFVSLLQAQTENIFLTREFWKTKPSVEIIEQKIAEGHSATALNSFGFDAVVYALLGKAPNETVKHLLSKKGNEVNKLTHDKRTYVFWAAYADNVEMMKYLIANNAKMDVRDAHHFSVLTFAAVTGQTNKEIYELCIQNGIDVATDLDEDGANALLLLTPHVKDFELIDYFASKGLDLLSTDNHGNGVFNYVARSGNTEILDKLIKKGVPYKTLNKKGENAMIFASQGTRKGPNPFSFFKYLEKLGIDANITTKEGITPLHSLAYSNKDIAVFNYFIDKGVDAGKKDDKGNTALLNASYENTLEVVKLLASKTNAINDTDKNGRSALTNAIEYNTTDVIEFLIAQKADIGVTDTKGNNLSKYVIASYDPKEVETFKKKVALLTNNGFDMTQLQKDGNTLYHLAIEKKDLELLKLIKNYNIDINAKNNEGLTVLHKAAMTAKNDKILEYLLASGADKTIKTGFEESVFDLANENEVLKANNVDLNFLK